MNQPDFTPISKTACKPRVRLSSMLATATVLALALPLLSACVGRTTTLDTSGLVTPQPTKVSCPTIALVKPTDAPQPPPDVSVMAVMQALGKDGWQWIWEYKQHNDEEHAKLNQIYKDCKR